MIQCLQCAAQSKGGQVAFWWTPPTMHAASHAQGCTCMVTLGLRTAPHRHPPISRRAATHLPPSRSKPPRLFTCRATHCKTTAPTATTAPASDADVGLAAGAGRWQQATAALVAAVQVAGAVLGGQLALPSPPAAAVLISPNAQIPRTVDAALRRSIPAFNKDVRSIQDKLEVCNVGSLLAISALRTALC